MEQEHLLPKGQNPYGSIRYKGRQVVYNQPTLDNYEPLPTDPPGIQSGRQINGVTVIEDNQIQGSGIVASDYSGYSWLSLLFCCFPLSIAAIYQSDQVLKSNRRGDFAKAHCHSVAARKLSALAIIYGILIIVVGLSLYFVISTQVTHNI